MSSNRESNGRDVDAIVVGAGFAGMYMIHRLRELGLSVQGFEAGDDVGGTWYWNRYPGARCDVESLEYSYQFDEALQQDWHWSERYAPQPEILDYCRHVADRFDLRRDIRFSTRVQACAWDEGSSTWHVRTDDGEEARARFLIMATGCLSVPMEPELPGKDDFGGRIFHTGRWPHEGVDFSGRRVAVIGTGSSGIQSIPMIAEQAAELTVYQRTPNHCVPARNRPQDPELEARVKANYADVRARNAEEGAGFGARHPVNHGSALEVSAEERRQQYEHHWEVGGLLFLRAFGDLGIDPAANETAAEFIRAKIRDKVEDPQVAEKLLPDTPVGCKRLCADSGYFETFNRDHVHLVDVRETPIETLVRDGIRTSAGETAFDDIVFATGFDAMTGALERIDIRGRDGVTLKQAWAAGPKTWLGLQVAGFPNLFTITGPGSPSVLSNMLPSIEQHVRFIADAVAHLDRQGMATIEADARAQEEWVELVNAIGDMTLYPTCNSWYLGANVPGKPRVFMPYVGFADYCRRCDELVTNGYEGFILEPAREAATA
ncbi:MAG: NAD(P)/FAD-dependent oxidoreductase [Gammaproteobacteria bacterium]|nr:NAD(P)/FAD-dependent oxidoreductase [Gammaproteobacteria bacterium]